MTAQHTADPYAAFAQLVQDMPGGAYIGDSWRTEKRVLVLLNVEDRRQCERSRVFEDICASFPSAGQEPETNQVWLYVPGLARDLLHWHAAEYLWFADEFDLEQDHRADMASLDGAELCYLLGLITAARHYAGDTDDCYAALDLLNALLTSDEVKASGLHISEITEAACTLLAQGYKTDVVPAMTCALHTTTVPSP